MQLAQARSLSTTGLPTSASVEETLRVKRPELNRFVKNIKGAVNRINDLHRFVSDECYMQPAQRASYHRFAQPMMGPPLMMPYMMSPGLLPPGISGGVQPQMVSTAAMPQGNMVPSNVVAATGGMASSSMPGGSLLGGVLTGGAIPPTVHPGVMHRGGMPQVGMMPPLSATNVHGGVPLGVSGSAAPLPPFVGNIPAISGGGAFGLAPGGPPPAGLAGIMSSPGLQAAGPSSGGLGSGGGSSFPSALNTIPGGGWTRRA